MALLPLTGNSIGLHCVGCSLVNPIITLYSLKPPSIPKGTGGKEGRGAKYNSYILDLSLSPPPLSAGRLHFLVLSLHYCHLPPQA